MSSNQTSGKTRIIRVTNTALGKVIRMSTPQAPTKPPADKTGRKNPKSGPQESKEAKFSRIASQRMTKALKTLSLLENLSAPSYRFTPDQARKIIVTLQQAVDRVEVRLSTPVKGSDNGEGFSV